MGSGSNISALLEVALVVGAMPWLVVLVVGAIVSLQRLPSQPREGWLVICAIAVAIFARFGVRSLVGLMMPYIRVSGPLVPMMIYEAPAIIFQAVAWVLLMVAAFGPERTSRSKYLVEDDDDRRSE